MPPAFLAFIVLAWGGILGSVVFKRRRAGLPLWTPDEPDALFAVRGASGASQRTLTTRLGGANNALYVAVTPTRIVMRPHVPFNLFSKDYELEHAVPFTDVRDVERVRRLGRDGVRLTFDRSDGGREEIDLFFPDVPGFFEALRRAQPGGLGARLLDGPTPEDIRPATRAQTR